MNLRRRNDVIPFHVEGNDGANRGNRRDGRVGEPQITGKSQTEGQFWDAKWKFPLNDLGAISPVHKT
jgi:hypothetical protein